MTNLYNYLLLFPLLFSLNAIAQDDVINSNRPGFSVSPYNVGRDIFQVESGFLGNYEEINDSVNNKVLGLDMSFRYAFTDKFELYTDFSTVNSQMNYNGDISKKLRVSPIILGAAYRFNEGGKYIPTVAARGGVMYYESDDLTSYVDLDLTIATQHDFASNWVFITNWKAGKVIFNTELSYILSITNTLSKDWSWFVENKGDYALAPDSRYQNTVNAGMAYLVNDNLQLDAFGGFNTDFKNVMYHFSVGVSWKLDRKRLNYHKPRGAENIADPESNNIDHK